MAAIVNARDVILQGASPRFLGVQVGSNIQVPITNVPGLSTALDGTKEVSLQGTSQVYQIPKTGSTTPSSITITATLRNLSGTPSFTLASGTMSVTPALSGGAFTFTPAQMTSDSVTFLLSLTVGGTTYTDNWTVVKVREGADALTGFLTNESCTVAADKLGNVTSYTGVNGNFRVFQGSTDVTTACTFSVPTGGNPNGLTYSLTASGSGAGTYGVTGGFGTGVDQVSLTIRATFGSSTIDKIFSISKSKAGAGTSTVSIQGDNLDSNNAGYYASPRGIVLSSGYSSTYATRGHTILVFNPANDSIVTGPNTYDTYGSPSDMATLTSIINSVAAGHILCLWTYDATSRDAAMNASLANFGSANTSTWSGSRVTNVFVGMKGLLPGEAYEKVGTYSASDTAVYRLDVYYSASGIVKNGAKGTSGSNGYNGARGSQTFYVAISGTSFSDATATSTASVNGGPIYGDIVTQYDNANKFSLSKYWNGSGWTTINAVVDGNLLVQGSVGAQKLVVNNGSGNNLWWDANYQQPDQWIPTGNGWGSPPIASTTGSGKTGQYIMVGGHARFKTRVPVTVGKQYRVSAWVFNASGNGTVYLRLDAGAAPESAYNEISGVTNAEGASPPNGVWTQYSGVWTATTPYVGAMIILNYGGSSGSHWAQDIRIEEMMDSALVVTGGITADRINTNGLTIRDTSGNLILGSGTALNPSYAAPGTLNSAISLSSGGVLSGGGGGAVTIGGLGYSGDLNATNGAPAGTYVAGDLAQSVLRPGNKINNGNIGTYMSTVAIDAAYIASLNTDLISTGINGGNARVVVTQNRIDVYDESNNRRVRLGLL